MDRKSRLAAVTWSSMGGDGTPAKGKAFLLPHILRKATISRVDSGLFFFGFRQLACWVLDGQDLGWFAWMSDSGLVFGTDLELNLGSLNHVCHSVLAVRPGSLSALHPAGSELLLLLDRIPARFVAEQCSVKGKARQHFIHSVNAEYFTEAKN